MIPPNIPIINVVGILGHSSTRRGFVADLESILATPLFPRHGANDGFLEYPAMVTPREWGLQQYEVTFDASHSLLDGDFAGRSLDDDGWRRGVISALLLELTKRSQGFRPVGLARQMDLAF